MLSVRELLQGVEVELRAGEAGLDHPVRWVHISELVDPTPWLQGGELLLTTGLQLSDAATQRAFLARLHEHGLAGVGLGTGFAHAEVPAAMVEEAEARGLPLFEVPYETPFIALTESAFARLVDEQYGLLRRSIAAQERLHRIVLSERGLDALAGGLATLLGGAVLVLDGRGRELARRTYRRALGAEAAEALAGAVRAREEPAAFAPAEPELAGRALVLPVEDAGAGRPQAWLAGVKDAGGLGDADRLLLQQGVTAVALELLRRRVADATERRLAGEVLGALVRGELRGAELRRRLEPFGLGDDVAALVVRPEGAAPAADVAAVLTAALRAEAPDALVARHEGLAWALLPDPGEAALFALGARAQARVRDAVGVPVAAGAGRGVPAARAREAFHEARCALEAHALDAGANGRLATFRDLGSFALLLSLQDSDALRLYCESLLGPLEADEGPYGGELVRSLEAFIECNGQWEAAAKRLFCHRHTLRYRMRKVEELTGRDLSSARDRIEFWLALRGRDLITPNPREETLS
jgi:purine catabolism regulator